VIETLMKARDRPTDIGSYSRATAAPNMAITDTDRAGVFVYIDTGEFDRNKLTIATDYVRFLMEGRTPTLPAWLQEGVIAVYNDVEFEQSPITLRPLRWVSSAETLALTKDPNAPRTLLSAVDLFGDGVRGERGPAHAARARAQCGLLVRWALDPASGVREAFWRFAARACSEPVTESMFEACFGFGFSDLRDRLSDYLPRAVKSPLKLPMSRSPSGPIEIRRATPTEIARVRGEWERLSVPFVRHRFPEHVVRYVEQARRTLQRAYDAGDRDPQLLATLGLCELEASNDTAARELLEAATAQGVARPRAYYELARLRWVELVRGQPSTREFEAEQIAPIVALLHRGLEQAPVLIDAVQLLADATFRSTSAPSDEDVKRLVEFGRRFVSQPRVCLRVARALSRHGKREEAVSLLGAGFLHVRDEQIRVQFAQLYAALVPSPSKG
jgi:hypothetical protein